MNKYKLISASTLVILLTACGGSGSDSKEASQDGAAGETNSENSGADNSGTENSSSGNSGSSNTDTGSDNTDSGNAAARYNPYLTGGEGNYRIKKITSGRSITTYDYLSTGVFTKIKSITEGNTSDGDRVTTTYEYGADERLVKTILKKFVDGFELRSNITTLKYDDRISVLLKKKNTVISSEQKGTGCEPYGGIGTSGHEVLTYNEDNNGNVVSVNSNQVTASHARFGGVRNGSVTGCSVSPATALITSFKYDSSGRLNATSLDSSAGQNYLKIKVEYDVANKVSTVFYVSDGEPETKGVYTYNNDGSIEKVTNYLLDSQNNWKMKGLSTFEYEQGDCYDHYPLGLGFTVRGIAGHLCINK